MSRDLQALRAAIEEDGLAVFQTSVPRADVLFFKSVLEAYPGLVSLHAAPGREMGSHASITAVCDAGVASEVASILREISEELGATVTVGGNRS